MADFSAQEKRNLSFKHVLGIVGTNNLDGANGRQWYEELFAGSHPVYLPEARADEVPFALNITEARNNSTSFNPVEDRSQGESITLTSLGSDWTFNSSVITPKIGYQITDVHPNASYIKSITSVTDNGGGSYTVTLNNNTGVVSGPAVLHSRLYLTLDPTSNNKTWIAKEIVGDFFSDRLTDFLSPIDFGKGYTVNLFESNGNQIQVTQGAWIFNWAEGLLIFAEGFTAVDESYSTPLYIEGFRYTGSLGVSGSALDVSKDLTVLGTGIGQIDFGDGLDVTISGDTAFVSVTGVTASGSSNVLEGINLYDTLFWNGNEWEPNDSLQISGSTVTVQHRLVSESDTILSSGIAPGQSSDIGLEGMIRWDYNYLYVHTGLGGWRRIQLAIFGSSLSGSPTPSPTFNLGLAGIYSAQLSSGINLDSDQNSFPIEVADINVGSVFTPTSSGVQVSQTGFYKVTWNLEGEVTGGTSRRRVLTTGLKIDGVDVPGSSSNGYVRDATNNTTNSQNTIMVKITAPNQTICIMSRQTGSGDPNSYSSFTSKSGNFLIEYVGII